MKSHLKHVTSANVKCLINECEEQLYSQGQKQNKTKGKRKREAEVELKSHKLSSHSYGSQLL